MPMTLQQLRSISSRVWLRINCSNQCLLIRYLQPAASRNESPIIYLPLTKKGLWVNAHIEQFYDLWYASAGRLGGESCSCASGQQRRFGQKRCQPPRQILMLTSKLGETSRPARTTMPPEPESKCWLISASGQQRTSGSP